MQSFQTHEQKAKVLGEDLDCGCYRRSDNGTWGRDNESGRRRCLQDRQQFKRTNWTMMSVQGHGMAMEGSCKHLFYPPFTSRPPRLTLSRLRIHTKSLSESIAVIRLSSHSCAASHFTDPCSPACPCYNTLVSCYEPFRRL